MNSTYDPSYPTRSAAANRAEDQFIRALRSGDTLGTIYYARREYALLYPRASHYVDGLPINPCIRLD